jgi:hypothetical protein
MILGEHAQQRAPLVFNCGPMGEDDHAILKRCVAGGDGMWFSTDLNEAHAATADWF